jgi:hypothetical protein
MAGVPRLAVATAAIARRIAGHCLQLANVAVRLAAHGIATHPDGARRSDDARDRLARTPGQSVRSAAIAVLRAQIADDVATACRLADEHAGRSPRRACAAAASPPTGRQTSLVRSTARCAFAPAELPVVQTAVGGPAGRRGRACAERLARGYRAADARAAIGAGGARIAGLRAEGGRLASAACAPSGAALTVGRAAVAKRFARRVERRAHSANAILTTAVPI